MNGLPDAIYHKSNVDMLDFEVVTSEVREQIAHTE